MHIKLFRRLAAATVALGLVAVPALIALPVPVATAATPSTSMGQVSVAQVMAMLDEANGGGTPAQVLTAYMAGLGEATGVLVSATSADGKPFVTCKQPLAVDAGLVRAILKKAAPDRASWTETAATPIIVSALVSRAGCS